MTALAAQHAFTGLKRQKCFVGDDLFAFWITARGMQPILREHLGF